MSDQTTITQLNIDTGKSAIDTMDRDILRDLAAEVADLAARPIEIEKKNLWYRHNALENVRPVIFCDPENGWNEIITDELLQCKGALAREWEMTLQKEIFWGKSMGDDRVLEPIFWVPYVYTESGWGLREIKRGGTDGGSYTWDPPLKSFDDLNQLHHPKISIDYKATEKLVSLAKEVFGAFLIVKLKGNWWWSLGLTWDAIKLRGLEQFMIDMYDHPNKLHQLMAILRDGILEKLNFLEQHNLLSLNNDGTYVGSGGFGYTHELPQNDFEGKVRTCDMWGFCESQETVSISPAMFEEFVFPYQLPILKRFGLNCYGCCEPLNNRWTILQKAPHLRRISISPWADLEEMAQKLGNRYIFSMKPSPTDLAIPAIDEEYIRNNLRRALHLTQGCVVEIIMKDNHTIGKNPQNVTRWCQIAREEIERL